MPGFTRRRPAIVLGLCAWIVSTPAGAAQYVVDGFALGGSVGNNQRYRSYKCKPSDDFAKLTSCVRSERKSSGANLTTAIVHAPDGTALYLMANIAPVAVTRAGILKEIAELSGPIKSRPTSVEWLPSPPGSPRSLVALWGQIKLERLPPAAVEFLAAGVKPGTGVVLDPLGDLDRSIRLKLPIYRIVGGPGYLYSASFDASGRGHRRYVAIDPDRLAITSFDLGLRVVLEKDRTLANNDYRLWPDVAALTRKLALATSPKIANAALDKGFENFPKKLRSHVWSILPGGAAEHLAMHQYWPVDIYGPNTKYPGIRRAIQTFLAGKPSDPFVEFLYYVIGNFDEALKVNPNSIIGDVLHYASGHKKLESLLQQMVKALNLKDVDPSMPSVSDYLFFLNRYAWEHGSKPLASIVPDFAAQAAAAERHFKIVLRQPSAPHADDAAYMLGWLALQQGRSAEALSYFSQAMAVGNGDYREPGAMRQTVQVLTQFQASKQFDTVGANHVFSQQPVLWYVAARSAYRKFNYAEAIKIAEQGLQALNVPLERLPATTDPEKIEAAIAKVNPQLRGDPNALEIPYIIAASNEIMHYESYLNSIATERPEDVAKTSRAIIFKYSRLRDREEQKGRPRELAHHDLRQALHLIATTLEKTPRNAQYAPLREWLYYRQIRIMAGFAPKEIPQAVSAMEAELPKSNLIDDALAEQLRAEGALLRNVAAAQATFRKLVTKYPNGNAIDNAYTWMAIIYRCAGRLQDEQNLNREIIRRFPLTRHARYAKERMANPNASACGLLNFPAR